jgi:predicted DNA-binding transcriptional regulator YafY
MRQDDLRGRLLARVIGLIAYLDTSAPTPRTIHQMAARFGVTTRTIRRDLSALQRAGLLLTMTKSHRTETAKWTLQEQRWTIEPRDL